MKIKFILAVGAVLTLITLLALGARDDRAVADGTVTTLRPTDSVQTSLTAGTVTKASTPTVDPAVTDLPQTEGLTAQTTTVGTDGTTPQTEITTELAPAKTTTKATVTKVPDSTTAGVTTMSPATAAPITTTQAPVTTTTAAPITTAEPAVTTTQPTITAPAPSTTAPAPETAEPTPETAPAESDPSALTYEAYLAMSPAEQQAHFMRFATPADYVVWLERAKADYEANRDDIVIEGDGSIDIGDIIGGMYG